MENRVVVFDLPFALLMADFDEVGEIYVAGTPPAGIGIFRIMNERPAVQSLGVLVGGDPYGRVSYSRAQVRFHAASSSDVETWDDRRLINFAVDRVNQLVEHYRDVVGHPLIRRVSVLDLVHFTIIDESPDGTRAQRLVSLGAGPLRVGMGDHERANEQEIRDRLQRAEPPPIQRLLELDIHSRLATGDYRLAVVEAATLFESWLRPALERFFTTNGESPAEVAAHFTDKRGRPLAIYAIVTRLIPLATGYRDFSSTPEYERWNEARKLRNAIAHGHRQVVTAAEAAEAVNAVFAAIRHLRLEASLV